MNQVIIGTQFLLFAALRNDDIFESFGFTRAKPAFISFVLFQASARPPTLLLVLASARPCSAEDGGGRSTAHASRGAPAACGPILRQPGTLGHMQAACP
jgi:hypothetical protein